MATKRIPIVLQVNCGYARVAIYELCKLPFGNTRSLLSRNDVTKSFLDQFSSSPGFHRKPPEYWHDDKSYSAFDRHSSFILDCFSKSWKDRAKREEYISVFSCDRWSQLSSENKAKHSMSSRLACARDHLTLQKAFPVFPCFAAPPIVDVNIPSEVPEREVTRSVLQELNQSFESSYQHKFVASAIKFCGKSEGIDCKKSVAEKKKERRKMQRSFRDAVNKQYSKNAGLNYFAENESFAGYQRKRLAQAFKYNQSQRSKSHIPSENSLSCYQDTVIEKVQEWPEGKPINWTELGRQCSIEGRNKGQIAKVIAEKSGVPVSLLSSSRKVSSRHAKAKLPGQEISMPSMLTTAAIRESISSMIEDGALVLGEPCSPFTLEKTKVVNGIVVRNTVIFYGRKIPLSQIRRKLILKHEKYMRLLTDIEIDAMTRDELQSLVGNSETNLINLQSKLKSLQRTRHLALWHDHSSILGAGYILMTVHVLYESAVFLTEDEYKTKFNESHHIQQLVEEPELYMLCLSSSSPSDQIATISDRLDCLLDLQNPIQSSSGIDIHDKMLFFVGDHPAQAYERGSQIGGNYKCGNCGCASDRMDDLAHACRCSWRTLEDLQAQALERKFGDQSGVLKPFEKLKKSDLQEELRQRGMIDVEKEKSELSNTLTCILRGAQRVPTILLTNFS